MKKFLIIAILCLMVVSHAKAQGTVAVKSNLLYDVAALTPNLGIEVGLSSRWTLDVSGSYNPWTFSDNRKMKLWLLQPELRYWSCSAFSGHFLGVHAHVGEFNFGGMFQSKHRYQGGLAGGGFSYGYHWILGKRWGLEATLGVGYAYMKYDKFLCEKCGDKVGAGSKHYIGPTKAGITLIYMIK